MEFVYSSPAGICAEYTVTDAVNTIATDKIEFFISLLLVS
jgi:hypothetical protein